MDYLFSEPHQADKCAQGACDNKAALQAIRKQVLSANATEIRTCICQERRIKIEILLEYRVSTHVDSMSSGSVRSELTEPVNRHL